MLERYLERLGAELGNSLPPEDVQGRLAEAAAHLEEAVQARIELGMPPDEAMREALAAFGPTERLGQEEVRREPRVDRRFLALATAVVLVFVLFGGGRSFPRWAAAPILGGALALHVAYWVRSAQLRRPQLATLVALFLPLWVALGIDRGTQDAAFVRDNLEGGYARNRAWRQGLERKESALNASYAEFARSPSALSPARMPRFGPDGKLLQFSRESEAEAARRWSEALANGRSDFEREWERIATSDAAQARLAHTTTLGFVVRAMGSLFASVEWGPAAFCFGTHLLAWALGRARGLRGRDRRRQVA